MGESSDHIHGHLKSDWFDYPLGIPVVVRSVWTHTYWCNIPDKNGVIHQEFIPKGRVVIDS